VFEILLGNIHAGIEPSHARYDAWFHETTWRISLVFEQTNGYASYTDQNPVDLALSKSVTALT